MGRRKTVEPLSFRSNFNTVSFLFRQRGSVFVFLNLFLLIHRYFFLKWGEGGEGGKRARHALANTVHVLWMSNSSIF